jgi:hypothetical protein
MEVKAPSCIIGHNDNLELSQAKTRVNEEKKYQNPKTITKQEQKVNKNASKSTLHQLSKILH